MMKTKVEKIIAIAGGGLFLIGFLMCCSGIQFPFINPKASLNRHLSDDFATTLPNSTVVEQSYWVGSRDPENVFKLQLSPSEIAPFIERLRAAAKSRNIKEDIPPNLTHFGPLYQTPPWWNNPALSDALALEFFIMDPQTNSPASHYRFLYSPSTGKTYVVWGCF
jgi:hypothetical protein